MKLSKVYAIALTLAKSQLRASRSGRGGESVFRKVWILAAIDAVAFVVCALIGRSVTGLITSLPASQETQVIGAFKESLVFIPALVPAAVLVAGVLFELSSSSKFASSDSINWLPVTQAEYVTASTLSIVYTYSILPSIIIGLTMWPALALGFGGTWLEMVLLSCVSLFYGGAMVEILRAAINRMSTAVMNRARRGALILRLAITIAVVLALQVIFNFVFLIDIISRFESALNVVAFLPILWASLAVRASLVGDVAENALFFAATVAFAGGMLWVAIRVRARYWSPIPSMVIVTHGEYTPEVSSPLAFAFRLARLDPTEETLVKKDFKGLARRRELLQYFSIPFVLAFIFLIEMTFSSGGSSSSAAAAAAASGAPSLTDQLPVWFAGGFFGLMISSISFGQEGRSASLLYSLPLTSKQLLRAKLFTSMLLAMLATFFIFLVITLISRPPVLLALEDLVLAVAITVQEVFIGTAFGAKYPDFQERPRPRFLDPFGIILMIIVGMVVLFVTALPSILANVLGTLPGIQSQVRPLFLASIAFAVAVIGLSYSWASRETKKLLVEFRG